MQSNTYTIADFLEARSAYNPQFSADGSRVFYLSDLTGIAQLYGVSVEGGDAVRLTDLPDAISEFACSPTDNVIIFSVSEGGNERDQLFLLEVETRVTTPLTNGLHIKHQLGSFSYDGRLLAYGSNERNGTDFDIYVLDIQTRMSKCIFEKGDWCVPAGFSPNGKYLAVRREYANDHADLYVCNLATGETTHISPHGRKVCYGAVYWLPDSDTLYIASDQDEEFLRLYTYSLTLSTFTLVHAPAWDIDGLAVSRSGEHVAVRTNEDGHSAVGIYDARTWQPLPVTLHTGEIGRMRFSPDGTRLVHTRCDARTTTDIYMLTLATGETVQLTTSPQGVPTDVLVEPELLGFASFDDLAVPAFVYMPQAVPEGKKMPTLIYIHGGPEDQYRPRFSPIIQYFVHAGYAVVAPNVRGSYGYGKTYMALDNVEKRMDSVKDIVALREYLTTLPNIDTDRVALYGGSYGGFMVLACLAFFPTLWAAGVDIVGIANFVTFLQNTAPYRRAVREAEYGRLDTDRAFLESISPINSIENITAPLMVIHGANDPRVPLSEAEQVVSKLRAHGREVQLLVYQDEGHGLAKLENKLDAYPRMVAFLHEALG
ncbi:MAG: S9 family peptidase [Candidatus Pacebacteria bacterium]|nr:S9 family peptidase [Candidatus Paceibacterota bacterium]